VLDLVRAEAAVDDPDAAAEPPAAQIVLDGEPLALGALGLGLEVGRGGVEEEQVDLEVERVAICGRRCARFGRICNQRWLIERHGYRTPIEARDRLCAQAVAAA